MKVSWTHRKVVWKTFGPIFSSVKCFDKSLEITLFYNVQRPDISSEEKFFFSKITSNFQEKTAKKASHFFLVKLKAAVFYGTPVNS